MANERTEARRPDRRAFRPTLDGTLESRKLLSVASASIRAQTAAGGQAVVVTTPDRSQFFVSVINGGTVRATPAPGGRVNLIVTGSTVDTLLEINEVASNHSLKSGAHTFAQRNGGAASILNVASIRVTSGSIAAIEGFRDAKLSGPITVNGINRVDRIAFSQILAGGSIRVGGDLNTLDVLGEARFSSSTGLNVGRDLNWFDVGGNLTFEKGANLVVGRDLGLAAQPAKGTGLAGQGLFVNGNLTVTAPSTATIGRNIDSGIIVNGNFTGLSRFTIMGSAGDIRGNPASATNIIRGTLTP